MITTTQSIVDACYDAIVESIGSLVGSRVFEPLGIQDSALPNCIFQLGPDIVISGLTCDTEEVILQVDFYGESKLGFRVLSVLSDTLQSDLHRLSLNIITDNPSIYEVSGTVYTTEKGVRTAEDGKILRIRQEYLIRIA